MSFFETIVTIFFVCTDYRRFEARLQMLQEQMMDLSAGSLKTTQKRTLFVKYVLLEFLKESINYCCGVLPVWCDGLVIP